MEETEKMGALKKVYAEIILNTAKEAAVRVMTSERKAHQFQYDLSLTKDEALRLLLRLKQTMDDKINEVEMKSQNQQRKIEELEAQLQEAEDIVSTLRAELNEVHMKLEDMENKQIYNAPKISEDVHCEEITKHTENGLPEAHFEAQTNPSKLTNGYHLANISVEEFSFSGNPIIPSILRSKKPALYRNGCTQRIHAYEGNILNGHFSLSGDMDDLKHEKCIREEKEAEGMFTTFVGGEAMLSTGKRSFDIKENGHADNDGSQPRQLKSPRKKRKRAARYRRSNASTLKSVPSLANQEPCDPPTSQSQDMPTLGETKVMSTVSPSKAPPNHPEMGVLSGRVETALGDNPADHMVAMNVDTEVASSLVITREKSVSEDCFNVPSAKEDSGMKNSFLVNSDFKHPEVGDVFSSPPPKDRFLKYTFQRKRKKESFSGNDSRFHEEDSLETKMEKKQNGNVEASNSRSVAESSRYSRRMAQVARQLLTLSDKKRWN